MKIWTITIPVIFIITQELFVAQWITNKRGRSMTENWSLVVKSYLIMWWQLARRVDFELNSSNMREVHHNDTWLINCVRDIYKVYSTLSPKLLIQIVKWTLHHFKYSTQFEIHNFNIWTQLDQRHEWWPEQIF